MAGAEMRPVAMDAARRLMRSMTTPISRPAASAGIAVAPATTPTSRVLLVVSSTTNGRAIPAIKFPGPESPYDVR